MKLFHTEHVCALCNQCHDIILDAIADAISNAYDWRINHPEVDIQVLDAEIAQTIYELLLVDEEITRIVDNAPELPDEPNLKECSLS